MASGDIIRISKKLRPTVKAYMDEFEVVCNREERIRLRTIADSLADYDPAGKFAYSMYATLLAVGDKDMSDLEVYAFFISALGDIMDQTEDSFEAYMQTAHNVAKDDMDDVANVRSKMLADNTTFEARAITSIRQAFIESDLFDKMVMGITNELQQTMLKAISVDGEKYNPMVRGVHKRMTAIINDPALVPEDTGKKILDMIDKKCPLEDSKRAEDMIREFAEDAKPLLDIMDMVRQVMGDGGIELPNINSLEKDLREQLAGRSSDLGESFMYIHRASMMATGFYMLIGSGLLGLDGNKSLAYALRSALKLAVEDAARASENVLKLRKETTPELAINLN